MQYSFSPLDATKSCTLGPLKRKATWRMSKDGVFGKEKPRKKIKEKKAMKLLV